MTPYPEIYASYVRYHKMISPDTNPLPYEQWMSHGIVDGRLPKTHEEIEYDKDQYLAKLYPDGSGLAGYEGKKVTSAAWVPGAAEHSERRNK